MKTRYIRILTLFLASCVGMDEGVDGEQAEAPVGQSELGVAVSHLLAAGQCETRLTRYDRGLEVLRVCGNGQACFADCPWIDALGEYYLGRERCFVTLDAPAPLACVPENLRCEGNYAQRCDLNGQWVTTQECGLCVRGVCQMECTPDTRRCNGYDAQTCNALGRWITEQTCPNQCTGAGVCTTPVRIPVDPCMRAGSRVQCR